MRLTRFESSVTHLLNLGYFLPERFDLFPAIQRSLCVLAIIPSANVPHLVSMIMLRYATAFVLPPSQKVDLPITQPNTFLGSLDTFTHIPQSIPLDPLNLFPHLLNIPTQHFGAHPRFLFIQVLLFQCRRDGL